MLIRFLFLVFLFGCQMRPTQSKEESASYHKKDVILVDTRSALEFESYHFSGSVSLRTDDFLILKEPKTKKRILDPDISQVIERLAKRGISPLKSVLLISEKKDSNENKKWQWLLKNLEIRDIVLMGFDEYRQINKIRLPQDPPEPMPVWTVTALSNIRQNSENCFVNWSELKCH